MNAWRQVFLRTRFAFSLPEVAIAIAVTGVSLMAVVGLLPGLLNADRGSGINSVISSLAAQAIGELESQPYQPPPPYQSPPSRVFLFSESGSLVQNQAEALYHCKVDFFAVPAGAAGAGGAAVAPSPGEHCSLVTLEFTWPVGSASTLNRRVIHATLANH